MNTKNVIATQQSDMIRRFGNCLPIFKATLSAIHPFYTTDFTKRAKPKLVKLVFAQKVKLTQVYNKL